MCDREVRIAKTEFLFLTSTLYFQTVVVQNLRFVLLFFFKQKSNIVNKTNGKLYNFK